MTEPGFQRALSFISGVWPTAELSRETVHAWRVKLQRFDNDRVMAVLFDLSGTEKFLPALSQVYQACVEAGRQAALTAEPPQGELTPFGSDPGDWRDRQWNALSDDEKRHWLQLARAQWPDWLPIKPDSPLLAAHAAALARGTIDPVVTP